MRGGSKLGHLMKGMLRRFIFNIPNQTLSLLELKISLTEGMHIPGQALSW